MKEPSVLLIHHRSPYPPMAALYLCDALEKKGVRCTLLPVNTEPGALAAVMDAESPTAVAMSVITSPQIASFVALSRSLKQAYPKIPVLWGGVHPSLNSAQCAKEEYIDHLITGQAEETFPDTVLSLAAGKTLPRIIPSQRTLPLDHWAPRWERIDLSKFIFPEEYSVHSPGKLAFDDVKAHRKNNIFYYLVTSRGCVFNCTFCSEPLGVINHRSGKKGWDCHSSDWVQQQVETIQRVLHSKNIPLDGVGLWDDMFWVDMPRARRILSMLKAKGIGYLVEARADQLLRNDAALLQELADTGCIQVFVGAESADQATLDYLQKGTRFKDYLRLIELGQEYHIAIRFSLIVGFPGESDESVNKTLDFAQWVRSHNSYTSISGPKIFTPYPGTVEFDRAVSRGLHVPPDTLAWSDIHRKSERYLTLYPWLKENLSAQTLARIGQLLTEDLGSKNA